MKVPLLLALLPLLLPITGRSAVVPAPRPAPPSAVAGSVPRGVWPLDPHPIRRRFDPPSSTWGPGHRGVDLAGRPGAPVRSALPGVVRFAGVLAGRGVVVVGHGDTRTTYEPVTAAVNLGQTVGAGEVIGQLTAVQSHCPPEACLHWGWLRGDTYLDPLLLVGSPGPVRLLPLWRDQPVPVEARPSAPWTGWASSLWSSTVHL